MTCLRINDAFSKSDVSSLLVPAIIPKVKIFFSGLLCYFTCYKLHQLKLRIFRRYIIVRHLVGLIRWH